MRATRLLMKTLKHHSHSYLNEIVYFADFLYVYAKTPSSEVYILKNPST